MITCVRIQCGALPHPHASHVAAFAHDALSAQGVHMVVPTEGPAVNLSLCIAVVDVGPDDRVRLVDAHDALVHLQ